MMEGVQRISAALETTMNNAYRDDLEAALARASDLEREVEALRKRNAELESSGQTDEARENARRLAAALEREREEAQIRLGIGIAGGEELIAVENGVRTGQEAQRLHLVAEIRAPGR